MLSDEQILKRIRDKIDYPVTVRELLQTLRVLREQHQTFKRRITAWWRPAPSSGREGTGTAFPTR